MHVRAMILYNSTTQSCSTVETFPKRRRDYIQPCIQHSSPITGNTRISTPPNGPGYQHTDHHKSTHKKPVLSYSPNTNPAIPPCGYRCCRIPLLPIPPLPIPHCPHSRSTPKGAPSSTLLLAPSIPIPSQPLSPPLMPRARCRRSQVRVAARHEHQGEE